MNINNFSELYRLLQIADLKDLPSFNAFIKTVDVYKSLCNCSDVQKKNEYRELSIQQYKKIINDSISPHIPKLKSKVNQRVLSFYHDKVLIRTY